MNRGGSGVEGSGALRRKKGGEMEYDAKYHFNS